MEPVEIEPRFLLNICLSPIAAAVTGQLQIG